VQALDREFTRIRSWRSACSHGLVPSAIHEAVIELVRAVPERILDLLHDATGFEAHTGLDPSAARIVDPTISQLVAPARACDLAIEIPFARVHRTGPAGCGVILEVQLRTDRRKELSWPVYWAVMRAGSSVRGGAVVIVVITTRRATERWAIHTLAALLPLGSWVVIGPSTMARIVDSATAKRDPEAAVLSAMIHAGRTDIDLVPAIVKACSTLRGMLVHDVITLEAQMQKTRYVWKSEFALRHQATGEARGLRKGLRKGRQEGRDEGARKILLAIVDRRQLVLSRAQRALVNDCRDFARLERWSVRAVTAVTTADIFASASPKRRRPGSPRSAPRSRA